MYMYAIRAEPAIAAVHVATLRNVHLQNVRELSSKNLESSTVCGVFSQQMVTSDGVAMARSREVCAFLDQTVKSAC